MTRASVLIVLCALAGLAQLSLATEECDLKCVLERLSDLEQKERKNEAEKMELHGIIAAQTRRIHTLEETVKDLKQDKTETKVNHISNTQVTSVGSKVNRWPTRHRHSRSIIRPRQTELSGIAFSAFLDHDISLPGYHTTIKFNKILINEGNTYNTHTGVFTCPASGVYLLTFSIGEKQGRESRVFMMKNSQNLVDANADSLHATQELQGGNTAIVRLSSGDAIWLESAQTNGFVEGSAGLRLTTFSGAYLYP